MFIKLETSNVKMKSKRRMNEENIRQVFSQDRLVIQGKSTGMIAPQTQQASIENALKLSHLDSDMSMSKFDSLNLYSYDNERSKTNISPIEIGTQKVFLEKPQKFSQIRISRRKDDTDSSMRQTEHQIKEINQALKHKISFRDSKMSSTKDIWSSVQFGSPNERFEALNRLEGNFKGGIPNECDESLQKSSKLIEEIAGSSDASFQQLGNQIKQTMRFNANIRDSSVKLPQIRKIKDKSMSINDDDLQDSSRFTRASGMDQRQSSRNRLLSERQIQQERLSELTLRNKKKAVIKKVSQNYFNFLMKNQEKEKNYDKKSSNQRNQESQGKISNRLRPDYVLSSSPKALQDGFIDYLKKHELRKSKPSLETEIAEMMRKESKNQLIDLSTKISDLRKEASSERKEWKIENGIQHKNKIYIEALESGDELQKQINELRSVIQKQSIHEPRNQMVNEKEDHKYLAQNSNLNKKSQDRIMNSKLNFSCISKDPSLIDEEISPVKFDKDIFGDQKVLKDIHRIAQKQQKQIMKLDKIRHEEELFQTPLLGDKIQSGKNLSSRRQRNDALRRAKQGLTKQPDFLSKIKIPSPKQAMSPINKYNNIHTEFRLSQYQQSQEGQEQKPDRYQTFLENEDQIVNTLQDDYSDVRESLREEHLNSNDQSSQRRRLLSEPFTPRTGTEQQPKANQRVDKSGKTYKYVDHTGKKTPANGFQIDEFRQKQSKFSFSMSLIEGNLQQIIKQEQKDYNTWKKEKDIKAANDRKLAMLSLNAGGSQRGKFQHMRSTTLPKGAFVSSGRQDSRSKGLANSSSIIYSSQDEYSKERQEESDLRVLDSGIKIIKKKPAKKKNYYHKRPSDIIENTQTSISDSDSSSCGRVLHQKASRFEENERFRKAQDQFKVQKEEVVRKHQNKFIKSVNKQYEASFNIDMTREENKSPQRQMKNSDEMQRYMLERYVCEDLADEGKELTEEQNQIVKLAVIESGDMELFEYSLIKQPKNLEEYHSNKEINQCVAFLSQGLYTQKIIFEFARAIGMRMKGDIITKFNKKKLRLIDSMVSEMLKRVKFKDICMNKGSSSINPDEQTMNASQAYLQQCRARQGIPLPIFEKIYSRKLILKDYRMSKESWQAFAKGIQYDPGVLNQIYINNCGVNEEISGHLLDGCTNLEQLQSFVMLGQEMGTQAIKSLSQIMLKPFPYQLQELKLIRVKMTSQNLSELLNSMIKQTFVSNLVLMTVPFNNECVEKLCDYLMSNTHLKQLDISWNELTSMQYRPLLECLSYNSTLQELNLSHNKLMDRNMNKDEEQAEEEEQELIENLKSFLINNQRLIHLFLNQCALSYNVIESIIPYIKFSPSLVAVHLQNEALTSEKIKQLIKIIGAPKMENMDRAIDFEFIPYTNSEKQQQRGCRTQMQAIKTHLFKQLVQQMQKQQQTTKKSDYNGEMITAKNLDLIHNRKILKELETQNSYLNIQDPFSGGIFLMQRVIGFDNQLQVSPPEDYVESMRNSANTTPGSESGLHLQRKASVLRKVNLKPSDWQFINSRHTKCWACGRKNYSMLFWNLNIGKMNNILTKNKDQIISHFVKLPFSRDIKTDRPVVYCAQNKWIGQELHTISEFCFHIDKNKGAFLNKISATKVRDYEFKTERDKNDYNFNQTLYQQLKKYEPPQVWRGVIHRNLDFRDAHFINCNNMCQMEMMKYKDMTTYVLPMFLRPGKFNYVIEYPEGTYYFHKTSIMFRHEPIPLKQLDYHGNEGLIEFDKSTSVFKDWIEDNRRRIDECLDHDFKNIEWIRIVEKGDITFVKDFVQEHYDNLRVIYKCILSQSHSVSGIDWYAAEKFFLKQVKVKKVSSKQLQDLFESALMPSSKKADQDKMDPNKSKKLLCRKEFIEFFIQIAKIECPPGDFKILKNILKEFLEEVLNSKIPYDCYPAYRETEIYCFDINNVLRANHLGLINVMRMYKKPLTFECIQDMLMRDSQPPIVSKRANLVKAAVLAKQTVVKDYESDSQSMSIFSESEFLEILCRVVDINSENTMQEDLFLKDKILSVLLQLMKIANPNATVDMCQRNQEIAYDDLMASNELDEKEQEME